MNNEMKLIKFESGNVLPIDSRCKIVNKNAELIGVLLDEEWDEIKDFNIRQFEEWYLKSKYSETE